MVLPLRSTAPEVSVVVRDHLAISRSGGAWFLQFCANAEFVRSVDASWRSILTRRTDQGKFPFGKHGADAFQQASTWVLVTT